MGVLRRVCNRERIYRDEALIIIYSIIAIKLLSGLVHYSVRHDLRETGISQCDNRKFLAIYVRPAHRDLRERNALRD